ncbi:LacI family DNA-binding transcriptional regulator [Wenxinia saemankumensis]|uniref:Transcriptional regulator, LacI family n=1 Tax=Wenxinia saemankumensis TaxID=1447782 RepID=A0A1M6FM80_9RHOB|nr:LacI family DNA-binding transcriptional regulator [Wenxinia saemankumensis]SHI98763.1 transcriptional regulator, LacI family [Wenxinia saemankumensis]
MATIYDVARKAGVSPKTVSRVLNADAPVRAETQDSVRAAIDELGYVPSSAARAMRSSRSGLVGLITGAITEQNADDRPGGLPEIVILRGIQRGLARAGLTPLITDTGGRADAAPDLMRTFAEHRVEGMFYVATRHMEVDLPPARDRKGAALPLVLVNCHDNGANPAILPDETALQRAITARVIAAGHARVAYLTLATALAATPPRVAGFRQARAEAGLPDDPDTIVEADLPYDDPPAERACLARALDRVLALPDRPTALMCGNDRMALRLYKMLRDRGLRVPRDISVAGFDNYRVLAETLDPALTTMELPYAAMGARAAELMVETLRRPPGPPGERTSSPGDPILVGGKVCWRDSVATRTAGS